MGDDRRCRATDEFPASDLRLGGGAVSDHPGRHLRRRSLPATISSVTITPASTRPAVIAPIQPRPTSRSTAIATAKMTRYRRVRGPRLRGDGSGSGGIAGPPILAVALTARVAVILLTPRPPRPRRQPTFVVRRQPVASLPEIRTHDWAADEGDGGDSGDNPTPSRAHSLPNQHRDDSRGKPESAATMGIMRQPSLWT